MLSPVEHKDGDTEPILMLAHLAGLDLRRAGDGWHGIWQVDGVKHQFWLPEAVPDAGASAGMSAGTRGRIEGAVTIGGS